MTNADARPWRLSLRMLLLLTAMSAFGCAGMMYASEGWLIATTTVSLLMIMAAVVAAVIDRGARQAFAIGFLICCALHLAALRWMDELPTRQLLEKSSLWVGKHRDVVRNAKAAGALPPSVVPKGQLKSGDEGPPVSALQAALNERLPPTPLLEIDGDFGYLTKRAVIAFQTSVGQPADGVVTLATWRAIGPVGLRELKRNGVSGFLGTVPAEPFVQIGEWLFTLLVGYVGGHLAQAAYARRRDTGKASVAAG